jgi:hypothetical protein
MKVSRLCVGCLQFVCLLQSGTAFKLLKRRALLGQFVILPVSICIYISVSYSSRMTGEAKEVNTLGHECYPLRSKIP